MIYKVIKMAIQIDNYKSNLKNMIDEYDKNLTTFNDTYENDENFNIFKDYFNNVRDSYYHIKNINSFSLLIENDEDTNKYIHFIENNLFSIKYFLKKFLIWISLNVEIKNFNELLLIIYKYYNNIININDFQHKKFKKINEKYYYNDIEIRKNKPLYILSYQMIYILLH